MLQVNYIIVGQGLAGSLLANTLINLNYSVVVIDDANQHAASKVASGIINPITGRRLVKSWMYDELKETFLEFYKDLENEFNESLIEPTTITRTTTSIQDDNAWNTMALNQSELCIKRLNENPWEKVVESEFPFGGIRGYRVNVKRLLSLVEKKLEDLNVLRTSPFDHDLIEFVSTGIRYGDISAEKIVFCEGWKGIYNPFFKDQAFEPAKGEVIMIKSPHLTIDTILKHKLTIVPQENEQYWVGTTFDWNQEHENPTPEKLIYLTHRLKEFLKVPFEISKHIAGIRPSTRDRRPLVMSHPVHPELFLLNGFGSKGTSLAPYFTLKLIDMMTA